MEERRNGQWWARGVGRKPRIMEAAEATQTAQAQQLAEVIALIGRLLQRIYDLEADLPAVLPQSATGDVAGHASTAGQEGA